MSGLVNFIGQVHKGVLECFVIFCCAAEDNEDLFEGLLYHHVLPKRDGDDSIRFIQDPVLSLGKANLPQWRDLSQGFQQILAVLVRRSLTSNLGLESRWTYRY